MVEMMCAEAEFQGPMQFITAGSPIKTSVLYVAICRVVELAMGVSVSSRTVNVAEFLLQLRPALPAAWQGIHVMSICLVMHFVIDLYPRSCNVNEYMFFVISSLLRSTPRELHRINDFQRGTS